MENDTQQLIAEWKSADGISRKVVTSRLANETEIAFNDRHDATVAIAVLRHPPVQ